MNNASDNGLLPGLNNMYLLFDAGTKIQSHPAYGIIIKNDKCKVHTYCEFFHNDVDEEVAIIRQAGS